MNIWLSSQLEESKCTGYVVGVSGGIDSALTSTLLSLTGEQVVCLNLPINQDSSQFSRSSAHIKWLEGQFPNVRGEVLDLGEAFSGFQRVFSELDLHDISYVNLQSRLRMCALYAVSNTHNLLVCGTGNRVEDFGIGFFTKYGDGGVDISPIADLLKSEVYSLSRHLGISEEILSAAPTDGLWGDNRGDEAQIGASYVELEWALKYAEDNSSTSKATVNLSFSERQREVFNIYMDRHLGTKHKMELPPVCSIPVWMK